MGLIVCESLLGSSTIWLVVRTQVCSSRLHEVPKKHLGYNSFRVLHGRDLFIRMHGCGIRGKSMYVSGTSCQMG